MIQLVASVLLFFVIFFGIAFILNMLLRQTWLMAFLYPFVVIRIIDEITFMDYFTSPKSSVTHALTRLTEITITDITILLAGFAGTIVSGFVIKYLRKSGYQMF